MEGKDLNARILKVSRWAEIAGRIYNKTIFTLTDGDASPSVSYGNVFITANTAPTVITMFDDGRTGQQILVIINDANTTFDFTGTNLKGNSGIDWTPSPNDVLRAVFDGTDWYCEIDGIGGASGQTRILYLPVTASIVYADGANNAVYVTDAWDNTNRYSYRRTVADIATQDIDLVFEFVLPSNFVAFTGANSIATFVRSSDFTNVTLTATMVDSAGNVDSTITASTIAPTADNTWETKQLEPGSAYTANERVRLQFHIANADAGDSADVGIVTVNYLAAN